MAATQTINLTLATREVNRMLHVGGKRGDSLMQIIMARLGLREVVCQVCGCTEESGCPDDCGWHDGETKNLCSRCARYLSGRDQFGRMNP